MALHYKASHMSFLHSFWGVGATISPLIMSHFLKQNGYWQGGYRFVSIIQMSLAAIMFITLPLWGKVSHASADELHGGPIEIDNRAAIRKRGSLTSCLEPSPLMRSKSVFQLLP